MTPQRKRILQEFSLWVAVSAARQGIKIRGHKLYPFLQQVDLVTVLSPEHVWSDDDFEHWHEDQVTLLAKRAGIQIGWSAKLINMLLKTCVYIAREGHPTLAARIHPPIDNLLIREVCRRYPPANPRNRNLVRLCRGGVPISGILTYDQYRGVIRGLSEVASREGCNLFEIESLWSARDEASD